MRRLTAPAPSLVPREVCSPAVPVLTSAAAVRRSSGVRRPDHTTGRGARSPIRVR